MTDLTPQDFAVLDVFVASKDRIGYWTYLMDKGDMYARLALGVVTNETLNGFVANEFFMDAAESVGLTPTPEFMQDVGLDIMRADRDARVDAVKEHRSLNLSVKDIQEYHHAVFLKHTDDKIGERGWTAELPLRRYVTEARRTGDWTEADRQWHQLLESDPRSLWKWGALDLGFDSNWDAFNSVSGPDVVDWLAKVAIKDRVGEIMTDPLPENQLGEYISWFSKTIFSSMEYEFSSEKNISNLNTTRIDGYSWDEARQKWFLYKRHPSATVVGVAPRLLAEGMKLLHPQPEFIEIEAAPETAEVLNRKRRNRLEWFYQKRPDLSALPDPRQFARIDWQDGRLSLQPFGLSAGQGLAVPDLMPSRASMVSASAVSPDKEQNGIILSVPFPPSLVGEPGEGRVRAPIALSRSSAEERPATVRDLRESQEALLLDLHIAETNRPPPEIDIHKIRDLLAREFDREVKCGRTIHTGPL